MAAVAAAAAAAAVAAAAAAAAVAAAAAAAAAATAAAAAAAPDSIYNEAVICIHFPAKQGIFERPRGLGACLFCLWAPWRGLWRCCSTNIQDICCLVYNHLPYTCINHLAILSS